MRAVWTCAVFCALSAFSFANAHTVVHVVPIVVGVPHYGTTTYQITTPIYPVTMKEARLKTSFAPNTGTVIYEQEFLPKSVVKINEPLSVPFTAPRGTHADGRQPTTVPAGSVFIEAIYANRQVYCTTLLQTQSWRPPVPLGICLYDPSHSGKFTQMIYFTSGIEVLQRHAYEVIRVDSGDSGALHADIDIAYESIPVDETYASTFEISIADHSWGDQTQKWAPLLHIAPTLATDHKSKVTALVNFVGAPRGQTIGLDWLYGSYSSDAPADPLAFGSDISVSFKAKPEGTWDLTWNETLPAGEYFIRAITMPGVFQFVSTAHRDGTLPFGAKAPTVALPWGSKPPSLGASTDIPTLPNLNLKNDPAPQQH